MVKREGPKESKHDSRERGATARKIQKENKDGGQEVEGEGETKEAGRTDRGRGWAEKSSCETKLKQHGKTN